MRFSGWWVLLAVGAGCRTVADHHPRAVGRDGNAPSLHASAVRSDVSCGIRIGLERATLRDDRRRTSPMPGIEPGAGLRQELPTTSIAPELMARDRALAPGSASDLDVMRALKGDPWIRPRDDQASASQTRRKRNRLDEHRPVFERVLATYFDHLVRDDRVEKTFGYRRLLAEDSSVGASVRDLPIQELDQEMIDRIVQAKGNRTFVRPAERGLTEIDFYRDVRYGLQDFKDRILEPTERNGWGRFNVAVLGGRDIAEIVEVQYRLAGWRVGTTAGSFRFSFGRRLTDDLYFNMSSRVPYDSRSPGYQAELACRLAPSTALHLLGGSSASPAMLPATYALYDPEGKTSLGGGLYISYRF